MNNHERIQARIARSKAVREKKKEARAAQYGRMDRVFTNQHMFRAMNKCMKGTGWKQSVMDYAFHGIVRNRRAKDAILAGQKPEPGKIRVLEIHERGKKRRVHAVAMDSRVIQGVLCDDCIAPMTHGSLIVDNPASRKGKGVDFARRRMMRHLRHGMAEGGAWVLSYDFSGFFDSMRHDVCESIFRSSGMDKGLTELCMHYIRMYQVFDARMIADAAERDNRIGMLKRNEGVGASLGSPISQDMALCLPSSIDHMVKDAIGAKHYMRYMDDGYAQGTKEEMRRILEAVRGACTRIGLKLHDRKTGITRLSKGFTYLKIRYRVTASGHIIRRLSRGSIVRMRRRMKCLKGILMRGETDLASIASAVKSWMGNARRYADSFRTRKSMRNLYYSLYLGYGMEGAKT